MGVYFENVNTEEAGRNGDNVDLYASVEPPTLTMLYILSLSLSLSLSHSVVLCTVPSSYGVGTAYVVYSFVCS